MSNFPLSPREKKLLRRMAQGLPDRIIAVQIGGRADQVRKQRLRLLTKLQISSRVELLAVAQRLAPWPLRAGRVGGPDN